MLGIQNRRSLEESSSSPPPSLSSRESPEVMLRRFAKESLLEYLTVYRLFKPTASTLLEQYPRLDFDEDEAELVRIARDPEEDAEVVELALRVYFGMIRRALDGEEVARRKLEDFLTGQRHHPKGVLIHATALFALSAALLFIIKPYL